MILILMGVSGSGKTTIGTLLAERDECPFGDADDYHPLANKEKMRAGSALNDEDREPWLERLNELLREWFALGSGGVLACSALKVKYRETLCKEIPAGAMHFVLLEGSKELISERMSHRNHEFMNPDLLDSQFKTLEISEDIIRVVNDRSPNEVVEEIERRVASAGESKAKKDVKL